MTAFSGLWDGVHGDSYHVTFHTSVPTPAVSGLTRVLMQKRGMFGHVNALGRNTIASRKVAQTSRGDVEMVGGYDYANRQNDAGNTVIVENMGDDVNTLEDANIVSDATEADMVAVYDTTLNEEYAADAAMTGVTATALARRNPT